MMKEAGGVNTDKASKIKSGQLFGIEMYNKVFALACANMMIHKDGETNLALLDAREKDASEWIKWKKTPTKFDDDGKIDLIENVEPYKAGYMTLALGGEYLGACFIQKNAFYTSQNVIVLIPKFEMTRNVKLFIATCIFKESRLHYKAFINELNRNVKKDFAFLLPAKQTNIPDFDYMDKYINNLCLQEKKKYDLI